MVWRNRQVRIVCMAGLLGMTWGGAALMWDARQVAVGDDWLEGNQDITAKVEKAEQYPAYVRLLLSDIERQDGVRLAGNALLYVYGDTRKGIQAGQVIEAVARWRLPRNYNNPGTFDYQSYCFDRHIALIGSLRGGIRIADDEASWLESMRQRVREVLQGQPNEQAGVLAALLLADRSRISTQVWEIFAAGGAAHLLAISGLHVGMAAAFAGLLFWWTLTRREAWIVRFPVRKLSLLAGLGCAIAYATLAGWPLPAQRAVMMLGAAAAAWWFRNHAEPVNTLLAALMLILIMDAGAVASISLWLSFAAAGALLVWAGNESRSDAVTLRGWMTGMLWVSLLATLATLPLVAHVFGRLPTYSLISNLLLVPLYSLAVLPMALLGELSALLGLGEVAQLLFAGAGALVEWGSRVLSFLHTLPGGNLWIPATPLRMGIFYGLGMLVAGWLLLLRRHIPALGCAAAIVVVYVFMAVAERPPATPQFIAWDVGQGAASSLLLPDGRTMVVDAPGRRGSRFNGGVIVAAGQRALGVAHVDVLVLSHAQSDHMGGAGRLFDQVRNVGEIWLADVPGNREHAGVGKIVGRLQAQGGKVRWLKQGDELAFGDVHVNVLWPPQGFRFARQNNTSLVLSMLLPGGQRLLLPGDIESDAERRIAQSGLIPHDVVLMPHHGSRTSSSSVWVKAVKPDVVIAQSGYANRYRFPAQEIVERYRKKGAQVWNTADGAVMLTFSDKGKSGLGIEQYTYPGSARRTRALQWWQGHL